MSAIESAGDAISVADELVGRYYPFRLLEKASQEDTSWIVEFDVGALIRRVVRVRIDKTSGKVMDFVKAG